MKFEQALQAMRIGKVVYNKQEPDVKYGIDDLLEKSSGTSAKVKNIIFVMFLGFIKKKFYQKIGR